MEKTVLARDGGTAVRTSPLPSVMDAIRVTLLFDVVNHQPSA